MSFANLKAARESRQSKSYVTGQPTPSQAPLTQAEPDQVLISKVEDAPVDLGDLFQKLPSSMEVRLTPSFGRGIWMKEPARAGSTLASVKPHIAVLANEHLESCCSYCCTPASEKGLKRCTKCRVLHYCDATCQVNDWPLHNSECSALKRWSTAAPSSDLSIPSAAIRCLGRILFQIRNKGPTSTFTREINYMQSHRLALKPAVYENHTLLAHSIVRYLGSSSYSDLQEYGLSSASDLVDIISRFMTNTFTVTSPSLDPLGVSVSPLVALINHSCDPNAVIVYPRSSRDPETEEPLMQIITIRDIEPGEQILTAYIDTTLPRSQRQASLEETYNFICRCSLCSAGVGMDPREVLMCPKGCGGVCPLPTEVSVTAQCKKCRADISATDSVLDALRVGQEALDKAMQLEAKDPSRSMHLAKNMIPVLTSAGLAPSCHPLLALNRLYEGLLVCQLPSSPTRDQLDGAIRVSAKSTNGLLDVLREGHPIRGIALSQLGRLLAVDEPPPPASSSDSRKSNFPLTGPDRLRLALQTLVRARAELLIGFGRANNGGQIGREIRESIVALEKELGVWNQGIRNALEDIIAS